MIFESEREQSRAELDLWFTSLYLALTLVSSSLYSLVYLAPTGVILARFTRCSLLSLYLVYMIGPISIMNTMN